MNNLEFVKDTLSKQNPSYLELCTDFLIIYSRFEYALKECGFLQSRNRVMASLENYALSISEIFKPEPESQLEKAVNFIIESPPKIQIMDRNKLIWQDHLIEGNLVLILAEYLRRIRNNLLHGGKYYGGIDSESRNWNLIINSILIIEYWIDLNDTVKNKFREF